MELLCFTVIFVPVGLWQAGRLIGPVYPATPAQAQFNVCDLVSLFLYLSIALGLATAPQRTGGWNNSLATGVLTASLSVLGGALWWIGVRTVNQASIVAPGRRLLFECLVVPLAYGGSVLVWFFVPAAMCMPVLNWHRSDVPPMPFYVGAVACVAAMFAAGWLAKRIIPR